MSSKRGVTQRFSQSESLTALSRQTIIAAEHIYVAWIKQGSSSLLGSYASSLATADLMHSAGLMSDQAYNAIFLIQNLFAATGIFTSIVDSLFGGGALKPALTSLVEQNNGDDEAGDETSSGVNAASLAALVPQIAEALA